MHFENRANMKDHPRLSKEHDSLMTRAAASPPNWSQNPGRSAALTVTRPTFRAAFPKCGAGMVRKTGKGTVNVPFEAWMLRRDTPNSKDEG